MHSFISGNLDYLRRPFVRNIKPGHRVLVLTDTSHDPRVWQVVQSILSELGADATVALFERRPADYYDPPAAVCEAMMKSDFNVLLASTGMLHCPANFAAMAAGIPAICMDGGMQLEWFQSGGVTEDMKQVAVRKHYVSRNVFGAGAKECRVTSRYGTEFTYSVEGRVTQPPLPTDAFDSYKIVNFAKDENRPGNNLLYYLFPREFTWHRSRQRQRPARHRPDDAPSDGWARRSNWWSGRAHHPHRGAPARILRDHLRERRERHLCPAEASVGINAKALIRGIQREDKNIMGTMHFGLGTNIDVGGSVKSKIHMDGVIRADAPCRPVMRIEHGNFLVPIDGERKARGGASPSRNRRLESAGKGGSYRLLTDSGVGP